MALLQLPALPSGYWLFATVPPLLLRWRGRPYYAGFVLGAVLAAWRVHGLLEQRWPVERLGEELLVTGVIATLPQGGAEADDSVGEVVDRTWRFVFVPDDPTLPRRIRVSWYRSDQAIHGGECWRLRLRLRPPHGSSNPGGFDYEGWLFRQGIAATATVRAAEFCGAASGYRLLRLRQRLAEQFAVWLPNHPGLPLVSALTIGDTSGLRDADWQNFRLTGTTHLVAISGFNVAIIAGSAFFLLRWLWSCSARLCLRLAAQKAGMVASALSALIYALLAGFEPPVARAAFMLLVLVVATWTRGLIRPSRALAWAWLLTLVGDPLALLAPGLWLSFGAVAAIFYIGAGRLRKQAGWRDALKIQLMLSLVLAPLTLYWFQGTSLIGPLVNLIAVPMAAVLTPAVLGALWLTALAPTLGLPVLHLVADVLAWSRVGLGDLAAHLPQTWFAASPEPAALLLAVLGTLLLFAPSGVPLRAFGLIGLAALLLPPGRAPAAGFELAVLDVGQGLAVVVRTAEHTLLFDAGPALPGGFDAGRAIVVPYLLRSGISRLDRMIISHSDLDHAGGAAAVHELLPVTEELGALSAHACRAGEAWDWDGVHFELLNGPAPDLSDNDGACVLKITSATLTALLPADIEAISERRLVEHYGEALHADVLLAPHHGSRTSSSTAFIEAVQPRVVIHSAGWHHRFRHPAPEVVGRYAAVGSQQYVTADSGAILISGNRENLRITQWRLTQQRIWTTAANRVGAVGAQDRR